MDGNLLDPDNADATLAKEWSLPELPAGVEETLHLAFQTQNKPLHNMFSQLILFYLKRTLLLKDLLCSTEYKGVEMNLVCGSDSDSSRYNS